MALLNDISLSVQAQVPSQEPSQQAPRKDSKDSYEQLFQASPRKAASICSKCIRVLKGLAKLLLFPITLLFLTIQYVAIKNAVTGSISNQRNEENLQKLRDLGGEFVNFKTEDGVKVEGCYLSSQAAKTDAKTILICSGSHQSHEYYTTAMADSLLEMGHHVMLFNYRGFGNEKSFCTENGIYLDAEAAYQYLNKEKGIKEESITLWGYSLGGAAATELATHHKADLVLDRSFATMSAVAYDQAKAQSVFFLALLAKCIFKIGANFNNLDKVKKVKSRVFLLSGSQDAMMKPYHLEKITKKITASRKKSLAELEDAQEVIARTVAIPHHHSDKSNLWFGSNEETATVKRELGDFLSF